MELGFEPRLNVFLVTRLCRQKKNEQEQGICRRTESRLEM